MAPVIQVDKRFMGSSSQRDAGEAPASDTTDEQNIGDRLFACVTKAFPELSLSNSRLECTGGDHVLLIVDDEYAFRFPRAGMHDLALEIAVLKLMQRRSTLATPAYDHIDAAGRFAGYRFIQGAPLTRARFGALAAIARDQVLTQAARFLSELHGLPIDAVAWSASWPKTWTAAEFAERGLVESLPVIAAYAPHLAGPIERFYSRYRHDRPHDLVIVHGDLVADHILLDPRTDELAGIIDFGDVGLGDPAQDFIGFWNYGDEAAFRLVSIYGTGRVDPGLLDRSRNHFIRYRIDRLAEELADDAGADPSHDVAEIDALLRRPPALGGSGRRSG